ncbi:MAG: MFS transporter, partial [Simkaniaceae bacterium]|nr:MFS transporter [Simkaniaceae bacterium]
GYALMRDIYLGHTLTKQLSYVSIFVGITPLIAPLMGGYIVQYGNWRGCFGLLLILAVFLLFLKFRYLPETLVNKSAKAHHPSVMLKNYQSLLRNKACIGPIVIASFAFSGLLTMGSLLPFLVIKELHFNPSTYGWIAGIPALAYLSGSFLVGQFGSKFCFSHLVIFGTGLGCISMGLALFFNWHSFDLVSLLIPLFGYLFGIGCIIPRASAEALSIVPHLTGSAAALLCACMFGVSACMIGIGSHLNQTSPIALFSLLLFTVFCTALTLIYSQRNV